MKIFKFKDENEEDAFYDDVVKFLLVILVVMIIAFMEFWYQNLYY